MRVSRTMGSVLLLVLLAVAGARAQGPGGAGPAGGGMGPGGGGMPGGGGRMGMPPGSGRGVDHGASARGDARANAGGNTTSNAALSPSGRWWDDRSFAKGLGLNGAQQKRMDSVFSANRAALQQRFDTFRQAQAKLDALKRSSSPSEGALFNQIDQVAQARAELEQAYTHMQLQIRGELTPEQITKLDAQH